MVEVRIVKASTLLVEAKGHSLFDRKGKDIVCAAISTILQNWLLGIVELCKVGTSTQKNEGFLKVEVMELNDSVKLLSQNMFLGLKAIEKQYKENIKIVVEEKDGSRWFR